MTGIGLADVVALLLLLAASVAIPNPPLPTFFPLPG